MGGNPHRKALRRAFVFAFFIAAFAALSASPAGAQVDDPTEPVACQPGFFSPDGNAPCTPAPPGTFVDTAGATAATPCAPGTFQPATGAVSCNLAPAGTFVDTIGATAATPCPAGTTSPVGSDSADDCVAVVADSDGDGVLDAVDRCAGTDLNAGDSPRRWQRFRVWSDANGDFVYRNGRPSGITVADTSGCSASQIVADLEGGGVLERVVGKVSDRLGFRPATLRSWIRSN